MNEINVMFVCLGNICRSPLAHGIMNKMVADAGLNGRVKVDSCGTAGYHIGEDADPRTLEVAQRHGVPMDHSAKKLNESHLEEFDLLIAMDDENLQNIYKLDARRHQTEICKMRDFDSEAEGEDVPDPWFGGKQGFEDGFVILHRSCEGLLDYLKSKLNE